ncbi:MAG: NAD-dependent deacetylase [Lachnospiraceae bacterium]|nr:NAD-dependent deacetylase [Lachnospiraceae bacterium]
MDQMLDKIRELIKNNDNIVLVSGSEVTRETGLNGIRADHIAYDIEEKYGYSSDEIVSTRFLSRQVDKFFDYYKNIILNKMDVELTGVHRAAAKLEKQGKLTAVVTRMIYRHYQEAGCENVVELYGSAEENRCPVCGRVYGARYIKEYNGTPRCQDCGVVLRPGFSLFGEMIDNGRLTKASNAIEYANVLLVAGASLNSMTWANMLRYYEGNKLVLINTQEKSGDERANFRAYGNLSEIFKYITDF